jgi:hypothetical protein
MVFGCVERCYCDRTQPRTPRYSFRRDCREFWGGGIQQRGAFNHQPGFPQTPRVIVKTVELRIAFRRHPDSMRRLPQARPQLFHKHKSVTGTACVETTRKEATWAQYLGYVFDCSTDQMTRKEGKSANIFYRQWNDLDRSQGARCGFHGAGMIIAPFIHTSGLG